MRILIAEDDDVLADGLTRSLRQSGYAVDHVANGLEADSALSTQTFDLLILDLGLPRMPGLEVLRRLRARTAIQELSGTPPKTSCVSPPGAETCCQVVSGQTWYCTSTMPPRATEAS